MIIINFIQIPLDLDSEILLYYHLCIIIVKIWVFFLGSKKRDLSDKSRNGEDSKKHRENSDSASLLLDDVLSDGFNSPECAKKLFKKCRVASKRTFCVPQGYQKFSN